MDELAKKAAEKLKQASSVIVVSHIDADGISSAGIASQALDHIGMEHEVKFALQNTIKDSPEPMDGVNLPELREREWGLFCDERRANHRA